MSEPANYQISGRQASVNLNAAHLALLFGEEISSGAELFGELGSAEISVGTFRRDVAD